MVIGNQEINVVLCVDVDPHSFDRLVSLGIRDLGRETVLCLDSADAVSRAARRHPFLFKLNLLPVAFRGAVVTLRAHWVSASSFSMR